MDLGLAGRAYVVTGGTRGLGRATAESLVAEGARVVVSGRDESRAAATAADLGGPEVAVGVPADNSDTSAAERLVAACVAAFGRVDGALVSVGGPPAGPAVDMDDAAWRAAFDSVFLGAIRMIRAITLAVDDDVDDVSIGLVLSTSVRAPIPGLSISNGLRPGLAMLAKTCADELGPRRIRVNGLLPGRIDTDRVRELDAAAGDPVANKAAGEASIPLRRYGRSEEFGRVAAFVLSPAASYVTGSMVTVDGGSTRAL